MAIQVHNVTHAEQATSVNDLVITAPTRIGGGAAQVGDLLVGVFGGSGLSVSNADGFVVGVASQATSLPIWWKYVTASEPASYTFSNAGTNTGWQGFVALLSGALVAASPIGDTGSVTGVSGAADVTLPAQTTTPGNLAFGAVRYRACPSLATVTPPTNWTEISEAAFSRSASDFQTVELATFPTPDPTLGASTWNASVGPTAASAIAVYGEILNATPPPTPRQSTSATATGNSASATANKQTGTVSTDTVIATIAFQGGSGITITPPGSGIWTLEDRRDSGTAIGVATYSRTGSDATAETFTLSGAAKWVTSCESYYLDSGSTPAVDVDLSQANASSTSVVAPGVTTTVDDALLRFVGAINAGQAGGLSVPAGMTERADVQTGTGAGGSAAAKTLYLMGGTLTNSYQPMQDGGTAPTDAFFATGTGWLSAANANGNMSELRPNVVRARTTFAATVVPTVITTGASANAFRSPVAYSGSFASGNWTLSASMRSSVAQPSTTRLRWRVFASADATGATGIRELTTAVQLSNATADTTTANSTKTVTWAAPAITLDGEYLFFACALEMVALSGTGNTRDTQFRQNSSSAVTTTTFTPALDIAMEVASEARPTAGATGTRTSTAGTNAAVNIGYSLVLREPTGITRIDVSPTGFSDTEAFGTEAAQLSTTPTGFVDSEAFGANAARLGATPTGFADTEAFGTDVAQLGAAPTGFVDAEAFGTETVQISASPTGFADTEAFGTLTAGTPPTNVSPTGFADTEAFGTPSIQVGAAPTGFADAEAFGTDAAQLQSAPTGFAETEVFGTESARLSTTPTGFADTEAFGTESAQLSAIPTGFADAETFGTEAAQLGTTPTSLVEVEAFGTEAARISAAPTGFADVEAFGTLSAGTPPSGTFPNGFADVEAFGTPSIRVGAAPTGFVDVEAFGAEVIQLGAAPVGFADTETFGTESVRLGTTPLGFVDSEGFGTDSASPRAAPLGFADTEAFGTESIRLGATPLGFADIEAFGNLSAGIPPIGVSPSGFADVEAFGVPVIRVTTNPLGFADVEVFGANAARLSATPLGFADVEAFGVLLLRLGITPVGFADVETFGNLISKLSVSPAGFADVEAFGVLMAEAIVASRFLPSNGIDRGTIEDAGGARVRRIDRDYSTLESTGKDTGHVKR